MNHDTKLYHDLAWLWPLWGAPEEYADYCKHVMQLMRQYAARPVRSLLNIGCGGGKNVCNLKAHCAVTGLDLSPRMLELAHRLNPECEFVQGDMRSFSLGRTFDAILVDDAVSYMASKTDLQACVQAAWQHLNPGGVMVVTPDDTTETFVQNHTVATPAAARMKPAGLDVVFIENNYDPDPADEQYEATMIYLIRQDGKLRVEVDHHTLGLFPLHTWRAVLTGAGFEIHEQAHVDGGKHYVTFACLKPGSNERRRRQRGNGT